MEETHFKTIINARTHLVVDSKSTRPLGGVGSNFYRTWVFPLYTPTGLTVVQEFPFDHPFHNGVFVGQHPVIVGEREANFWAMPPRRSPDAKIFSKVGRMDAPNIPKIEPHEHGVRFTLEEVWRDSNEEPIINEIRTVNLYAADDATICDMTSQKIATYGTAEYPKTKYGSIGIRVEPRLLPVMGGVIIGDNNRRGKAEVIQETDSDFVAYENDVVGHGRFGVLMSILDENARGPWFIRDYGMAMYNPTWRQSISTPEGESWTISLRVVAYDGELTEERARCWIENL